MIRLNKVEKYYNRHRSNEIHVVNNISLKLPDKGMVGLFGRSGCGKTTLLNVIGGLDKYSSGDISFNGEEVRSNENIYRNRDVGYIFQNYNLSKNETVFENVADSLLLCGVKDKKTIERCVINVLKEVGLEKFRSRYPDALSGGQQQRVAIARAIVKNPAVILADEPTGNLDEANTIMIMDILKEISRDHLVVLVTHEANLVDYYCDSVIELSDGKVVSERSNLDANGYYERDKNDIFLGELEKKEASVSGTEIEYFGDEREESLKIRIVHYKGKTFIETSDPNVKLLDKSSEIKLKEGVFEEKKKIESKKSFALEPFETGTKFGKLFNFKHSLISGYRTNFTEKKKSKSLLKAVLAIFACIMVINTVNLGSIISEYNDYKRSTYKDVLYLNVKNGDDIKQVLNDKDSGIVSYDIFSAYIHNDDGKNTFAKSIYYADFGKFTSYFSFGDFETFSGGMMSMFSGGSSSSVNLSSYYTSREASEYYDLVCGKIPKNKGEIAISKGCADEILKRISVGYVTSYDDLIYGSFDFDLDRLSIVGIVDADENYVFVDNDYLPSFDEFSSEKIKEIIKYGNEYLCVSVHTADIEKTKEILDSKDIEYTGYNELSKIVLGGYLSDFIESGSSVLLVLLIMSVCMFLLMRSSLMKRVKEIGIYRAVGASKKNIIYRFAIEALVLTALTVVIGFILLSLFINVIELSSKTIANEIYYPFWLALTSGLLTSAICVFFGTLPVMFLVRKTPSEIISKYDI